MNNIRLACTEELDSVYGIVRDATRYMDEQGIPQWDDIYPNKAKLEADIRMQQMYVIEVEGRVVGLIVINEDQSPEYVDVSWAYGGRVLVVHRLTIHPAAQRGRLATLLMDFAEETATREGYDVIRLEAFTRNPAALALYEHRGYRKAGAVRFRKGDFFCYEKQLNLTEEKSSNKSLHRIAE